MTLTSRGWAACGTAVACYVGSRVLGTVELSMLAAAVLVAIGLGVLTTAIGNIDVEARRRLRPRRLEAGTNGSAEVMVVNRGDRTTPLCSVVDSFTGRREVRFAVPAVPPGARAQGGYRIPAVRRGMYEIGPLVVSRTDPLGLVRRAFVRLPSEPVTVYPKIEAISPLPFTATRDFVSGEVHESLPSRSGDEFHGLREYAIGDDLRRVHWRSTARTGRLMIREHDVPWQARATVLVDDRAAFVDSSTFEQMVSAAASVSSALHRDGTTLRLVTGGGGETGWGHGPEHLDAILERLALLEPREVVHVEAILARLSHRPGSGALVAVLGDVGHDDVRRLGSLLRRFRRVVAVRFMTTRDAGPVDTVPGLTAIDIAPGRPFSTAWNEAVELQVGSRRRGSRRRGALR